MTGIYIYTLYTYTAFFRHNSLIKLSINIIDLEPSNCWIDADRDLASCGDAGAGWEVKRIGRRWFLSILRYGLSFLQTLIERCGRWRFLDSRCSITLRIYKLSGFCVVLVDHKISTSTWFEMIYWRCPKFALQNASQSVGQVQSQGRTPSANVPKPLLSFPPLPRADDIDAETKRPIRWGRVGRKASLTVLS